MMTLVRNRRSWLALSVLGLALLVPSVTTARGRHKGLCAATQPGVPVYVAIMSAFPGETAPLAAATEITDTVTVEDRQYYIGRLEGVNVILGLTGIGLVNADMRTRSVLKNFDVAAVIMDGVAGGLQKRIADVLVADRWVESKPDGSFRPNRALFALAQRGQAALPAPLEKCTTVRPSVSRTPVCLSYDPTVTVGGLGTSSDGFKGTAFPCIPGGGPIFGCDLPRPMTTDEVVQTVDNETASVARAAARRGVPFLGVRSCSDGPGDPFGDRGFDAFYDFYRLAAKNASIVTRSVLAELHAVATDGSAHGTCRLLTQRQWRRAAQRIADR